MTDSAVPPLSASAQDFLHRQRTAVRSSLLATEGVAPAAFSEAKSISDQLGDWSPEQAAKDVAAARDELLRRQTATADFRGRYPLLAERLGDVKFLPMVRDDMGNLQTTEGDWDWIGRSWRVARGTSRVGTIGAGALLGGRELTVAERREVAAQRELAQAHAARDAGWIGDAIEIAGSMVETIGTGLAVGAVSGPAAPVTVPSAVLAQSWRLEAGNLYAELLEQGYTPAEAGPIAWRYGTAIAGVEAVGLKFAAQPFKALAKEALPRVFARGVSEGSRAAAFGSIAGGYLRSVVGESSTEGVQEALGVLAEQSAARGAGRDVPEFDWQRVSEAFWKTARGMTVLGGLGAGGRLAVRLTEAADSQHTERVLKRLEKTEESSQLASRSPDERAAFVTQAATRHGGTPDVFIDGGKFAETLRQAEQAEAQESGKSSIGETLDQLVPGLTQQVEEAERTGSDVVLPTGDYVAKVGKALPGLRDHVRFDEHDFSPSDGKAVLGERESMQKAAKKLLDADSAFAESARKVEDRVAAELQAARPAKVSVATVNQQAKFYRDFVAVQANRLGITPEEFDKRYLLRVQKGEARAGELMQFAGVRAASASQTAAADARSRLDAGEDPEAVRRATGWFRGPDGGMRFEIDDSEAHIKKSLRTDRMRFGDALYRLANQRENSGETRVVRLGEIYEHGPLFAAYPELRDVQVAEGEGVSGSLRAHGQGPRDWIIQVGGRAGTYRAEDILAHEIQHAIQRIEGFNSGANPAVVGQDAYVANAGEVEARNTAARRLLNDDGRRNVPPDRTADVPAADVLLRSSEEGSRGSFDPRTLTVKLNEKADSTTFLHEVSHYYLTVLADIATQPDAPAGMVADFQTLLDWFGVKDAATWNAMSLDQQRKHHEAFAYSFETYLWEGKSPTIAMQGVFSRFKAFLRRTYISIRDELNALYRRELRESGLPEQDLPVLTPEVRGVFDRMLASEDAIADTAAVRDMVPSFQTREEFPGTDAEWAKYQEDAQAVMDASVAKHTADSLRQMKWLGNARGRVLRELQAEHKEARSRVLSEEKVKLHAEPLYRAHYWLTKGRMLNPDGTQAQGDKEPNHKLDREAVRLILGPDADLSPIASLLSDGGRSPDSVAEAFQVGTGETLVRELLSMPPVAQTLESRTDARMLIENAEFVEGTPEHADAINSALHDEARMRFVATELRHLTRAGQPVRLMMAAAKEAARQAIASMPLRDIRPDRFAAGAARAARDALQAMKKGDPLAVMQAKRKELIQHAMAKQALEVRAEVEKALRRFARFDKDDKALGKTQDIDYVQAGRALWHLFRQDKRPLSRDEVDRRQAGLARINADEPVLAERINALNAFAEQRDYRALPIETFRDLANALDALWENGKASRFIVTAAGKVAKDKAREEIGSEIAARGARGADRLGARAPDGRATIGQRAILRGWGALASLKRFRHWARFMDGGKENGPFYRYFVEPIASALTRARRVEKAVFDRLHPAFMKAAEAAGPLWHAKIEAPELRTGYTFNGIKEVMGAMLQAGSHSGLEKFLVGDKIVPPPRETGGVLNTAPWDRFLARMFEQGKIPKEVVDAVRTVWGEFDKLLPDTKATFRETEGYDMDTLEHRPMATPFGELSGGYAPAMVDWASEQGGQDLAQLDTLEGDREAIRYSVSAGKGHTITRNPNFHKKLVLDPARLAGAISKHIRYAYLQSAVKSAERLFRDPGLRTQLEGYDAEAIRSIGIPFLQNASRQTVSKPSGLPVVDAMANWLRAAGGLVALGFNFMNAAFQVTGLSNATTVVKPKFMLAAAGKVSRNPMAAYREAASRSDSFAQLQDVQARAMKEDIDRLTEPGIVPGAKAVRQKLARAAFWPQRMVQGYVNTITWHAAYEQHIAEAADGADMAQVEAAAVKAADEAVVLAQGSRNPEDLAAYEAGVPWQRLFAQFSSYSNLQLNQILGAQPGKRSQAAFQALVMAAILEASLRWMFRGVDDEDDDGLTNDLAEHYGKALLRNALGLVPLVGPGAAYALEGDTDRIASAPGIAAVGSAAQGLRALFREITDEDYDMSGYQARNLAAFFTLLTGMPLSPVGRAGGYAIDVEQGRANPEGAVDVARGLVTGAR